MKQNTIHIFRPMEFFFKNSFNKFPPLSTKLLFFFFLGILTMWIFLRVEIRLLLGEDTNWSARIRPYEWILHIHATCGVIALFTGAIQFFSGIRKKYLQMHRIMGRFYVAGITIASLSAIWIASRYSEPSEGLATVVQSGIWLFTTTAALFALRDRNIAQHRLWMMRSYALTCTFVISRFVTEVLQVHLSKDIGGSTALIWILTVGVLLFADSVPGWDKNNR